MVVESWGKGKPDYYGGTIPAGQEWAATQNVFHLSAEMAIAADTTTSVDPLYTVASGKRLILGYIKSSIDKNSMFNADLLVDGESYCPVYIYQSLVTTLSNIGGFDFEAGTTIGYCVVNYLDETINIAVEVQGYLYDI